MQAKITAVTHNGVFHADDVFAAALLRLVFGDVISFIRTRDENQITNADIVFDVGGVYDPFRMRFDHHQVKSPSELARPNGCPYAAFGLMWLRFGKDLCRGFDAQLETLPPELQVTPFSRVDSSLVQAVDAGDTMWCQDFRGPHFGINAVVKSFNLRDLASNDVAFEAAVVIAKHVLSNVIQGARQEADDKLAVVEAFKGRQAGVMNLKAFKAGWLESLKALDKNKEVMYVVFKDDTSGQWRVQCASGEGRGVSLRPLPEAWTGKSRDELKAIHPGLTFCHPGRFICGAADEQAALEIAKLALRD